MESHHNECPLYNFLISLTIVLIFRLRLKLLVTFGDFQICILISFIYLIEKIKLMDVSMVIWSSYGYWVAFNVTEAAGEWGLDVKKNNGFLIQIQSISEQLNITDVFGLPDCTAPLGKNTSKH